MSRKKTGDIAAILVYWAFGLFASGAAMDYIGTLGQKKLLWALVIFYFGIKIIEDAYQELKNELKDGSDEQKRN